jgi:hypothetical protein
METILEGKHSKKAFLGKHSQERLANTDNGSQVFGPTICPAYSQSKNSLSPGFPGFDK